MNYVGIDLHKRIIVICVLNDKRDVVTRKKFNNAQTEDMKSFFASLAPFEATFEATAAYDWFYALLEPCAERVALAHPKKLRIIAESTNKSDRVDAQLLATFLAMDMIPEAHCPSPFIKGYRDLVRFRCGIQNKITSAKNRIRTILAKSNRDRAGLFTREGKAWLSSAPLSETDRHQIDLLMQELDLLDAQLKRTREAIREYVRRAPARVTEALELARTVPGVGEVTADVVVSELGDVRRFSSQKGACSYAGLVPGRRQSADREVNLPITRNGSRWLRWVLVQAAWSAVRVSAKWRRIYDGLCEGTRSRKKAIIAVARRLLCVLFSLMRSGRAYSAAA